MNLSEQLKKPKTSLDDFREVTIRSLSHMQDMISEKVLYNDYLICSAKSGQAFRTIRPIRMSLFLEKPDDFEEKFDVFLTLTRKLQSDPALSFGDKDAFLIDQVVYTIQQSLGIGFDLLFEANSARKHVGNRFEELLRIIFSSMGITLEKKVLKIPYETELEPNFTDVRPILFCLNLIR